MQNWVLMLDLSDELCSCINVLAWCSEILGARANKTRRKNWLLETATPKACFASFGSLQNVISEEEKDDLQVIVSSLYQIVDTSKPCEAFNYWPDLFIVMGQSCTKCTAKDPKEDW